MNRGPCGHSRRPLRRRCPAQRAFEPFRPYAGVIGTCSDRFHAAQRYLRARFETREREAEELCHAELPMRVVAPAQNPPSTMTQEWFSPVEIALTPVRRSAPSAPFTTIGVVATPFRAASQVGRSSRVFLPRSMRARRPARCLHCTQGTCSTSTQNLRFFAARVPPFDAQQQNHAAGADREADR